MARQIARPRDAIQNAAIIHSQHAARLIGQHRLDRRPFLVREVVASDSDSWDSKTRNYSTHQDKPRMPRSAKATDRKSKDPSRRNPASLTRVLSDSCSSTHGYGVADAQTFSRFGNKTLPSTEPLNFGTGGYG